MLHTTGIPILIDAQLLVQHLYFCTKKIKISSKSCRLTSPAGNKHAVEQHCSKGLLIFPKSANSLV